MQVFVALLALPLVFSAGCIATNPAHATDPTAPAYVVDSRLTNNLATAQTVSAVAAPLVAVNFIISLTFSILGKAAPAMHVFGESFAVRIVVGLTLLGLTLTLASQLLLTALHQAPELMLRIIP